jgi:hypothetical protein
MKTMTTQTKNTRMEMFAEADGDRALSPLQAASCAYRMRHSGAGRAEGAELAKHAEYRQTLHAGPVRQRASRILRLRLLNRLPPTNQLVPAVPNVQNVPVV